jgi:hypothetical protein
MMKSASGKIHVALVKACNMNEPTIPIIIKIIFPFIFISLTDFLQGDAVFVPLVLRPEAFGFDWATRFQTDNTAHLSPFCIWNIKCRQLGIFGGIMELVFVLVAILSPFRCH